MIFKQISNNSTTEPHWSSCDHALKNHWWELPQVYFCRNKGFVATNTRLSRQKYACCDKTFVTINIFFSCACCFSWQTKQLSRQNYVCHQKCCQGTHTSVTTKDVFCHDKRLVLLCQTHVCCNKLLSWQKWYLWQLPPEILKWHAQVKLNRRLPFSKGLISQNKKKKQTGLLKAGQHHLSSLNWGPSHYKHHVYDLVIVNKHYT